LDFQKNKKSGIMDDKERQMWVMNDEGLYRWWKSERKGISDFIKEHRQELTDIINKKLGRVI
jgi:aspartate/tyrosine/aromatic aminotransferase